MHSIICFSLFILLMLIGVPVSFSIISSAIVAILIMGQVPLVTIPTVMFTGVNSFVMLALPLFIFGGRLMEGGGTSKRIFKFADGIVGWSRGGLGAVNVISSMIFGGISGSSVADAGSIGKLACHEMSKYKYPRDYSGAVSVASSTLSVIIPPSIVIIMFAVVASQSVGKMLAAGLVPGILIALSQAGLNFFISRKHNYGEIRKFSFKYLLKVTKDGILALITPAILLGGIFGGLFTATEGAAIAVLYILILGFLIYKETKLKTLWVDLKESAKDSAGIFLILMGSNIMNYLLIIEDVPSKIAMLALQITPNRFLIATIMIFVMIIAGMLMDIGAAIIILTPIFLPVAVKMGFDPVHFGVVIIVSMALGLITPPVAPCLMILCKVCNLKIERVAKQLIPFIILLIVTLFVLLFVPQISTFFPNLIYK